MDKLLIGLHRPRIWAWGFVLIASVSLLSLPLHASLAFRGAVPGTYSLNAFVPTSSSGLFFQASIVMTALYVWGAIALFRQDRAYWRKGARFSVRSVHEARVVLNLSPKEREAIEPLLADPAGMFGGLFVGIYFTFCLFASEVLNSFELVAFVVLGGSLAGLLFMRSGRNRAKVEHALASTQFACSAGLGAGDFRRHWWKIFNSNGYYRQVLTDIEQSPFEDSV